VIELQKVNYEADNQGVSDVASHAGIKAMNLSDLLRQGLAKRGLVSTAESARFLGTSVELVRKTLRNIRVPKDKTLIRIAERLGIDAAPLILAAHQQKLPLAMRSSFLEPSEVTTKNKRIWPLSREQCDYLAKVINLQEIQILRKYRQLLPEGKSQTEGYIDYMFTIERIPPPPSDQQLSS